MYLGAVLLVSGVAPLLDSMTPLLVAVVFFVILQEGFIRATRSGPSSNGSMRSIGTVGAPCGAGFRSVFVWRFRAGTDYYS
jgi:hypothetical protein